MSLEADHATAKINMYRKFEVDLRNQKSFFSLARGAVRHYKQRCCQDN